MRPGVVSRALGLWSLGTGRPSRGLRLPLVAAGIQPAARSGTPATAQSRMGPSGKILRSVFLEVQGKLNIRFCPAMAVGALLPDSAPQILAKAPLGSPDTTGSTSQVPLPLECLPARQGPPEGGTSPPARAGRHLGPDQGAQGGKGGTREHM